MCYVSSLPACVTQADLIAAANKLRAEHRVLVQAIDHRNPADLQALIDSAEKVRQANLAAADRDTCEHEMIKGRGRFGVYLTCDLCGYEEEVGEE